MKHTKYMTANLSNRREFTKTEHTEQLTVGKLALCPKNKFIGTMRSLGFHKEK